MDRTVGFLTWTLHHASPLPMNNNNLLWEQPQIQKTVLQDLFNKFNILRFTLILRHVKGFKYGRNCGISNSIDE